MALSSLCVELGDTALHQKHIVPGGGRCTVDPQWISLPERVKEQDYLPQPRIYRIHGIWGRSGWRQNLL